MCRCFLDLVRYPGDPLGQMLQHFRSSWKIAPLTGSEIQELEKFLSIMDPLERLFAKLNAERTATIHRVYPCVKVRRFN